MEFLKLEAQMENDACGGYLAWISNSKKFNMLVKGETPEAAAAKLVTSLKVAIAYHFDVKVSQITELSKEEYLNEVVSALKTNGKKQLVFNAA